MLQPTDAALIRDLDDISSFYAGGVIALYKNDVDPQPGFDPALLVEATFDGYGAQDMGAFLPATTVAPGYAQSLHDVAFTWVKGPSGGSQAIYGYMFKGENDVTWRIAERFAAAPIVLDVEGAAVSVKPVLELGPMVLQL